MDFKVTNSFSRDNLNYENGLIKNIHYGDIHTKFQTLFDITKEVVPFVNEEINVGRISDDFYCKEGDVIFADASEDLNDVGKSIEIVNLNNEKLLSGLHTLLARPKENIFSKGFIGYLLKSPNIRLQIQKEAQGSKVLSINVGRISNIILIIPCLVEQSKIANFLTAIDVKINNVQSQIEKMEIWKKGLLQKMFV
jgi:type I restriction enzyme S subunit